MTLFDASRVFRYEPEPRARRTDPDTSREAAAAVKPHASELERHILDLFAVAWLTDDELCRVLHEHHSPTVKTARSRLSKRGLLVDTGETRPSDRGRAQTVWTRA